MCVVVGAGLTLVVDLVCYCGHDVALQFKVLEGASSFQQPWLAIGHVIIPCRLVEHQPPPPH